MKNCKRSRRQVAGFTLIELMIVLLILAILVGVAVPSFGSLMKKNNIDALQAKLTSAVGTARSEAASRNVPTSICLTANYSTCATVASTNWSAGWIVFSDPNGDGVIDAGEEIIDVFENTHNGYTIKMNPSAFFVTFSTQGFVLNGGESTVTVCDPDATSGATSSFAKGLYVAASGLIVKTGDQDNNGLHNDPSGGADLTCL